MSSWYHTEATSEELAGVFRTLADEIEECDIEPEIHWHWERELKQGPPVEAKDGGLWATWRDAGKREVWVQYTLKNPREASDE